MDLQALHQQLGAVIAPDGIPQHYGDQATEYQAALETAVLMDRSHEGRFVLTGRDRLALPQRMSTNDLLALKDGHGAPTLFTNATGRVIDRATIYALGDSALVLAEPGRGDALRGYLQRNIFFNDDVKIGNLSATTRQFALHGPAADAVIAQIAPELTAHSDLVAGTATIAAVNVTLARTKSVSGSAWSIIPPNDGAAAVFAALLEIGAAHGLKPAGSLTYNVIRIRSGRPGVARELTADYIPLELGLWDEISFSKGCYTGQEIIARMESRRKLAKTIVTLTFDTPVTAPAPLLDGERTVGTVTSAVQAPDGESFGIGVVKLASARVGAVYRVGESGQAVIKGLAGTQPVELLPEEA